jgi:hypothetical protein
MKIVVLPAVAAWLLFAPGPGMADGIQPGLWRITTSVLNNGEPMPPRASLRCLTTAQAEDVADTLSPRFGGINTSCERVEYEKSEQKVTWRLICKGQVNMDSKAEFTFHSPIRYTATIVTKSWVAEQLAMESHVTLEGEFVGVCQ